MIRSRLRQLLLSEEQGEAYTNDDLEENAQPEAGAVQATSPEREVGEDAAGSGFIWGGGSGQDSEDGTEHLCGAECEADVESRHCLQEDHAEAYTLERIEYA